MYFVLALKSAHLFSQPCKFTCQIRGGVVIHETHDTTLMIYLIGESDAVTTIPLFQPSPVSPTAAEVCETQPRLGASISSTAFYIFLQLSRKMTWTRCLSISQHSASPQLPVLHALLYETHEISVNTDRL